MATSPPSGPVAPPPYGPPPRSLAWQSPGVLVALITVVIIGVFVAVSIGLTAAGLFGFSGFLFLPFCGVFLVILVVIVIAATQGSFQRRIPPPPPIQQPMVPAGQTGPVALSCPTCGAPAQSVDRFGVATCTYCNTRFLVR